MYCSWYNEILKISNFGPYFDIMWSFCCHSCYYLCCCRYSFCFCFCCCRYCYLCWYQCFHFRFCFCFIYVYVAVYVAVSDYVSVVVAVVVVYFCCIKIVVQILSTVITDNIVASISVTTVNVTKYVIVFFFLIFGVSDGVVGGCYVWLTMLMLPWLIIFILTSFTYLFKFRHGKMSTKNNNTGWRIATVNGQISKTWRFMSFDKIVIIEIML